MAETISEDPLNAPPPPPVPVLDSASALDPSATLPDNSEAAVETNAPAKRGRGRPPKAKTAVPAGIVTSPPRPRGRPPKARDPSAEPASPKAKAPAGSGRPRGRPPKKAKTAAPVPAASTGGAPRGRGRPPKIKPAVAPVAG